MKKSYEELLAELKDIIEKIESGEASLEESITLYEKGTDILRQCEIILQEAEMKVTELQG
ncbi:exodeoxyribonuclease VII small subunit [Methanoplanus endosymbiosus]|uniref:Exodeoxyribonuclease VII small subunit n=1 Tax=Methanoplanus endosymbiosus TaxID=33865 RepID=A0A9E7PM93_9EURY|nr:exodeoxyribonuclease VII small subunit [Methanoplanus endosymbiosus]